MRKNGFVTEEILEAKLKEKFDAVMEKLDKLLGMFKKFEVYLYSSYSGLHPPAGGEKAD